MMRRSLAPSERAASTYSRSRSDSVWPRTTRPTDAHEKNAITTIEIHRLGPDDRDERDREEQERERQHDVHEPRQHACRRHRRSTLPRARPARRSITAAVLARTPDEQRDPRAVDDAHEDVAPERVGAEQERASSGRRGRPSGVRPDVWNSSFGPWPVRYANSGAASAMSDDQARSRRGTRSRRDRGAGAAQASCHGLRPSIARSGSSGGVSTSSAGSELMRGALGGSARAASASSSPSATGK